MHTLEVKLNQCSYNIHIGNEILNAVLRPQLKNAAHILIVTDSNLDLLYSDQVRAALPTHVTCNTLKLPSGEVHKTWHSISMIIDALIAYNHDRHSVIISLGGGVIGDLTGFAAAIYMRGMQWIQIPTSLLAQVDAAIGGKTGCNYGEHKNLLGVFKQPHCVVIDTRFLQTLSQREFNNGLAEVVKCAFACDAEFFEWLENNLVNLNAREPEAVLYAIRESCRLKMAIVQQDETDLGVRQYLNFGHTYGHAIEAATGFSKYLHGEAVAIGMMFAVRQAVAKGMIDAALVTRLQHVLEFLGLPTKLEDANTSSALDNYIGLDKKKRGKIIRMILPCALGKVTVVESEF